MRYFLFPILFGVFFIIPGFTHAKEVTTTETQTSPTQALEPTPEITQTKSVGPIEYQAKGAARFLPDISVIGSFAASYFQTDPSSDEEVGHNPARTGFTLQEVELSLQSVIDPYFRGDVFIGFHEDEIDIEEAFVTTQKLAKGLEIRAGKFLLPFGRQNQKHLHTWSFANNPLVNHSLLGPEGLGELGVGVSYVLPTSFYLQLQGSFTNGDNEESFGGERKEDFLYNARLSASFDLTKTVTLLLGASGAFGYNNSGDGNITNIYGGDIFIRWKPSSYRALNIQAEYLCRQFETPTEFINDGGFYVSADYQFEKRWSAGLRFDKMGLPDDSIPSELRITPALTFNPTEFSRLRLQYEYDKKEDIEANNIVTLQLQFNFGPHGAHPY